MSPLTRGSSITLGSVETTPATSPVCATHPLCGRALPRAQCARNGGRGPRALLSIDYRAARTPGAAAPLHDIFGVDQAVERQRLWAIGQADPAALVFAPARLKKVFLFAQIHHLSCRMRRYVAYYTVDGVDHDAADLRLVIFVYLCSVNRGPPVRGAQC